MGPGSCKPRSVTDVLLFRGRQPHLEISHPPQPDPSYVSFEKIPPGETVVPRTTKGTAPQNHLVSEHWKMTDDALAQRVLAKG